MNRLVICEYILEGFFFRKKKAKKGGILLRRGIAWWWRAPVGGEGSISVGRVLQSTVHSPRIGFHSPITVKPITAKHKAESSTKRIWLNESVRQRQVKWNYPTLLFTLQYLSLSLQYFNFNFNFNSNSNLFPLWPLPKVPNSFLPSIPLSHISNLWNHNKNNKIKFHNSKMQAIFDIQNPCFVSYDSWPHCAAVRFSQVQGFPFTLQRVCVCVYIPFLTLTLIFSVFTRFLIRLIFVFLWL